MSVATMHHNYGTAIREGFRYLLREDERVFVIGQGLWSPWYVGNSMTNLDIDFGRTRIIDTPVSEQACTGAGIGAAIAGRRPIVVHPRVDFMILATDQIVTQAANWSSMFGGRSRAPVVFRGIVNRGGQQGAQHSQALHAWFAHVPGLRVVMPATVADARDLLVSAVLCGDPVLYIDDRWLYDLEADIPEEPDPRAIFAGPQVRRAGEDVTIVAASHSVRIALEAAELLAADDVSAEVIDLRVINPLQSDLIVRSVQRTGRLLAVDGGWSTCGLAGEIIARVCERLNPADLKCSPRRVCLPTAPAPTSGPLEARFYTRSDDVQAVALSMVRPGKVRSSHYETVSLST